MSSSRRVTHRSRSHLVALATVGMALAAAPKAQAQLPDTVYWGGGAYDGFSIRNWYDGLGRLATPDWHTTNVLFGYPVAGTTRLDDNGIVINDVQDRLNLKGMAFYNQDFTVRGQTFRMINTESYIMVETSPTVRIENEIHFDVFGPRPTLSLDVAASSTLTMAGSIYGLGALYKSDYGTAILAGFHNYTEGTNVDAGRLIDLNPHGNYRINADLEFRTATSQTFSTTIFGGGRLTKSGAGTLTMNGDTSYTGSTIVNDGRLIMQTPGFSAGYVFNGGDLEFRTATSQTYARLVDGTRNFTKSGSGTLTLSGTENRAGSVSVDAGKLIENKPMSTTYSVGKSSTLQFNTSGNLNYFRGTIGGAGSFVKGGTGDLTFLGVNTYSGVTTISSGRLIEYHPHGPYYVNDSSLVFMSEDPNNSVTYSGAIYGSGAFAKSGVNTLTLTYDYANSFTPAYSGGTSVTGGRLIDLHPHGDYTLSNGADLEIRNANYLAFETPVAVGPATPNSIGGVGNFTKSGAGDLVLLKALTYEGSTTINEGLLFGLGNNPLPTSTRLSVNTNGTLLVGSQTVRSLAGGGKILLGGALIVDGSLNTDFSGIISLSGSFTKTGIGTQTLSGVNTYSGGTTVSGGRLIDLNPHGNYVEKGGATLEFAKASDFAFDGIVEGSGAFVKSRAGAMTLTGSIKEGIKTTIANGTLKVTGTVYDDVTGAAGTTLQFDGRNGFTYKAQYSGAGALLKTNRDVVTMTHAPTNTGGVRVAEGTLSVLGAGGFGGGLTVDTGARFDNVSRGTLTVDGASAIAGELFTGTNSTTAFAGPVSGSGDFTGVGTVQFDGGYSPGNSPASIDFGGDLKLGATNVLMMELGGTMPGMQYDHLDVRNSMFFDGALNVAYLNGFVARIGDSFDLFDFNLSNGAFSSINLPRLAKGYGWNTSALYTNGSISVQAVPEPSTAAFFAVGALGLLRRRRK